jgi:hypothetical protein
MNTRQGAQHDRNDIDRDLGDGTFGRSAAMVAQPELGLWPDQWSGTGAYHRCSSPRSRAYLSYAPAAISVGALTGGWRLLSVRMLALMLVVLLCASSSFAYSVLTHEEIVDLAWSDEIRPLLLRRYPALSEEQITEAHAYVYGGAVIQDLGYYPFGSTEFSDLVHYVRSGDFVREMVLESQDVNEFAFALGALSHYASDIAGHPAVNQAVAIEFPKLRAKYGKSVRYAQDKTAHLKTEFGFDPVQVAKNRYASQQYQQRRV